MQTDPIADMLAAIKNGQNVGKKEIILPFSKIKKAILFCLKKEGYLSAVKKKEKKGKNYLWVKLKYGEDGKGAIRSVKRISKPGNRFYVKKENLPRVLKKSQRIEDDLGLAIISTTKGVMNQKEAAKKKLGGEVICEIW